MVATAPDQLRALRHGFDRCIDGRFTLVGIVLAFVAGCQSVPQQTQLLEARIPEARITSATLRIWTTDFVLEFADQVEHTADQISAQTESRDIQRNALLWKINSVQAAFRAASRRDALAAYIDVWVLCHQMNEFFDHGQGSDSFGPCQSVAVQTARDLESRIEEIGTAMLEPEDAERKMADSRRRVEEFVQQHPLKSMYFHRDSLSGRPESLILHASSDFGEIAVSLEQDLMAMQRIVTIHAEFMPTLTLWQVQLMLHDARASEVIEESVAALRDVPDQIHQAATSDIPRVVGEEVSRALAALTAERKSTIDSVNEMRSDTLEFVQQERAAVVDQITKERMAAIEEVRAERLAVMDDIRIITRESTTSAMSGARNLIDHFINRLTIIAGGFALIAVIMVAALLVYLRTRSA